MTDNGLQALANFTGLTNLVLTRSVVSDNGLQTLAGLTGLTMLYLNKCAYVSDVGIGRPH